MKILLISLLILSEARPQVLPVWSSFADVGNAHDGDTIDNKYASIPYVEKGQGVHNGYIKYNTLRNITTEDSYSIQIHCRVPENVKFYVTGMTDTSVFPVLQTYHLLTADNQSPSWIDTTFEFNIPKEKSRYSFYRLCIIRQWTRYQTYDSMYVDGVILKKDTVVVPDTVRLSVAPLRDERKVNRGGTIDVLGRRADKYSRIWFELDSTGRYRVKFK